MLYKTIIKVNDSDISNKQLRDLENKNPRKNNKYRVSVTSKLFTTHKEVEPCKNKYSGLVAILKRKV